MIFLWKIKELVSETPLIIYTPWAKCSKFISNIPIWLIDLEVKISFPESEYNYNLMGSKYCVLIWSVFWTGIGYISVVSLLEVTEELLNVPEKYCWAKSNDCSPIFSPIILPFISSIGGCIPPQILDKLVWSEASW